MRVRVLLPKSRTATGVVAGMLFTIASILESPIPLFAQSMVRVDLLSPLVWRQEQGRMDAVGHLQLMAEREAKGVATESLHVALTTNADRDESEMSHPSPPHPILAPQSNGSIIINTKIKTKFKLIIQNINSNILNVL
jgi:hypothetical protein